jgi:Transglycosylase SLT domain
MKRGLRLWRKLERWQRAVLLLCLPLLALNCAVGFFGHSVVFPLSPYFLKEKMQALGRYAMHLPRCMWSGHGDVSALAREAEVRHRLPNGLMRAVVEVESGGRPHRISCVGAMGPAQLMPGTADGLGVGDPFDPRQAIDAGARYLAAQLKRTGRVDLAIAAYNAGPGAVNGRVPRNGETEFYVAKVMRELKSFKAHERL